MKTKLNIILIISVLFFLSTESFTQQSGENASNAKTRLTYVKMMIRTAPKLTIEFSGFYNYGIFELSANDNGDFSQSEFIKGENFGVRHGVGGSFVLKIPLHEKGNIRLDISGMYSRFSSKFSKMPGVTSGDEYVLYNVYSGGIGIENNFTPNHKIKTLVGAGFLTSVITGNANLFINNTYQNVTIKPAFRLGLSFFSGVEYLLRNNFGLNFGFKLNHANLWLKDSKTSDKENEIYLNDKRVLPRIPYSGWKQFAWGSFYGGINIYFGIKEKTYTIRKI
jgi:hypothetical protein